MGATALETKDQSIVRPSNVELYAAEKTVANQLVCALRRSGIDTYFGVPGGAIEPLFSALAQEQRRGQARLVSTRSEAGAAFAADGYVRATGRPAACVSTTGPGASNLITGVMNAHADRIPLLVLTPQTPLRTQGRGALQDSSPEGHDMTRIFESCTKYSTTVSHPEQLAPKLMQALVQMHSSPKGPVHLSIPSDILKSTQALDLDFDGSTLIPHVPLDVDAVRQLFRALQDASRPVLYVGDDAGPDLNGLLRLADYLNASVVSSPAGKRWLGHLHPRYLGVVGLAGHANAQAAMEASDLVVTLGATFDELSTNHWTALPRGAVFAVDRHNTYSHRLPHAVRVLGEPGQVAQHLLEEFSEESAVSTRQRPATSRTAKRREAGRAGSSLGVHPVELMDWLSDTLPDDVAVHVDTGNGFCWSTHHLERALPDTYRVSMGLSAMGWAIGAVIGSVIGNGRRTVCVCGDGSMLMTSLELTTAVQEHLPVTYIVLNDSSLGMVRHGQRLNGAEPVGFEIPDVRFDRVAKACGARSARIESVEQLAQLPSECLESDDAGPWLLDVRIDREAVPPMMARIRGLGLGPTK